MTLTNTTVKQRYNCNGSTTAFTIPFPFIDEEEILVYLRNESVTPATETLLTLTTHYTLSGGPPVTTVNTVSTYSSSYKIVIQRSTDLTQETDYIDNDSFPAEDHETALDKLTQITQELDEILSRAILIPVTSALVDLTYPEPEANTIWIWNDDADELEAFELNVTETEMTYLEGVTSSIQDQLDDLDADITALAAGAIGYTVYASVGSPTSITAAGGITATTNQRQARFIVSNGGSVTVSANPQVSAGTTVGQEFLIIGTSDTDPVVLSHGTGLTLNGACTLRSGATLLLLWTGSTWNEIGRNSL